MTTEAKIGLLVPGSFVGTPPSMQDFTQFFRRADELGFDSLWVIDRIFHDINILEPMTLLTCAAAVTNRIRLGTSVLLFLFRNPVQLAKAAATLDHLSGGRLTLGISLGGRDFEFGPMGIDRERRVSRFRESLALMRKLWTEDNVTHHGRFYDMDNVTVLPKPVQKPGIPIWFGGSAEGALKRAPNWLTVGWAAAAAATTPTARHGKRLKTTLKRQGRTPNRWTRDGWHTSMLTKTGGNAARPLSNSPTLTTARSTTLTTIAFSVRRRNAPPRFRGLSTPGPKP